MHGLYPFQENQESRLINLPHPVAVHNYKIIVQFDGTEYCGWQTQSPQYRTVQSEIARVLKIIAKKRIIVTASSRTDSGVHAIGQTANFHLPITIEPDSLQRALNSLLPDDIRIAACALVNKSFNARFHATRKTYVYRLFSGQVQSPFASRYAAHIPYPLDRRAMRRSLRHFVGTKDFTSFTSGDPEKNKVRTIESLTMRVHREEITFTVTGQSFLRYMVRNIVGTIIDIGRGKIKPAEIPDIIAARDRRRAGQTAPARGLTLMDVSYRE